MEKEIWKDVKDCDRLYEVSNMGAIRTKSDKAEVDVWYFSGYAKATLISNNGLKKQVAIHRVVAEAFIPNPDNKAQVNHKNGVRTDNCVENLEWMTARENLMHARYCLTRKKLVVKKGSNSHLAIAVVQYAKDGDIIAEYGSITEAATSLKINMGDISSCCSGRKKTAGGFIWKRKK